MKKENEIRDEIVLDYMGLNLVRNGENIASGISSKVIEHNLELEY